MGGILGFFPDDERLVDSLEIAKEQGISFGFEPADLGYVHPNTVKILFTDVEGKEFYIMASSIGGGKIEILEVNGIVVNFTGEYPTIVA